MPVLTLPRLLATLRALYWSRYGAIAKLTTLDALHWQCFAVEADRPTRRVKRAPPGTATTPEGAVQMAIDGLHDMDLRAAQGESDLVVMDLPRTLAEGVPTSVTVQAPVPVAGDAVAPALVAFVRALAACRAPEDCALCWHTHRREVAAIAAGAMDGGWKLAVRRTVELGRSRRGASAWLKREVARLDAAQEGTAPYTVQCDPAELGADGRATDDVAEVA